MTQAPSFDLQLNALLSQLFRIADAHHVDIEERRALMVATALANPLVKDSYMKTVIDDSPAMRGPGGKPRPEAIDAQVRVDLGNERVYAFSTGFSPWL